MSALWVFWEKKTCDVDCLFSMNVMLVLCINTAYSCCIYLDFFCLLTVKSIRESVYPLGRCKLTELLNFYTKLCAFMNSSKSFLLYSQYLLAVKLSFELLHILYRVKIGKIWFLDTSDVIYIMFNSTNDCTSNSFITYNYTWMLLHVSTLIRHLQGAFCARLKLHGLLYLIKLKC
jgi:hypothetical protein